MSRVEAVHHDQTAVQAADQRFDNFQGQPVGRYAVVEVVAD